LIQYIAEHNAVPQEYQAFYEELKKNDWMSRGKWKNTGDCTYEEYLLLCYLMCRDQLLKPFKYNDGHEDRMMSLTRYTPWEAYRIDRALRLQLALYAGAGKDKSLAKVWEGFDQRYRYNRDVYFDQHVWGMLDYIVCNEDEICNRLLYDVADVVKAWYKKTGTLPATLGEMEEGEYKFSEVEVTKHPFSDKLLEYHRNASPPPKNEINFTWRGVMYLNNPDERELHDSKKDTEAKEKFLQSGGTYLRLNRHVLLIVELPKETSEP
jgi:hypothetical protein